LISRRGNYSILLKIPPRQKKSVGIFFCLSKFSAPFFFRKPLHCIYPSFPLRKNPRRRRRLKGTYQELPGSGCVVSVPVLILNPKWDLMPKNTFTFRYATVTAELRRRRILSSSSSSSVLIRIHRRLWPGAESPFPP